MKQSQFGRLVVLCIVAVIFGGASGLLGTCGPFIDTAADAFCPLILEVFYLGITTGTTPTTYDPAGVVNRTQMAAFLSRSVDASFKRGSRRAALDQFWTTQNSTVLGLSTVGINPYPVASDGIDLWVANGGSCNVSQPEVPTRVPGRRGLRGSWRPGRRA